MLWLWQLYCVMSQMNDCSPTLAGRRARSSSQNTFVKASKLQYLPPCWQPIMGWKRDGEFGAQCNFVCRMHSSYICNVQKYTFVFVFDQFRWPQINIIKISKSIFLSLQLYKAVAYVNMLGPRILAGELEDRRPVGLVAT